MQRHYKGKPLSLTANLLASASALMTDSDHERKPGNMDEVSVLGGRTITFHVLSKQLLSLTWCTNSKAAARLRCLPFLPYLDVSSQSLPSVMLW